MQCPNCGQTTYSHRRAEVHQGVVMHECGDCGWWGVDTRTYRWALYKLVTSWRARDKYQGDDNHPGHEPGS